LEAVEDIEGASDWYDAQRRGLGNEFIASLEHLIQLILDFPEAFPEIAASHRRAHLHRFPFALYYRVEENLIEVVACLHTSRDPSTWSSRG
jgi:plasmid stabilization system protein ParE